ncbi:MAG: FliI/YscN family ATPase, partial [Firmicutes bacterium]|nr:FliI/YscN family ATPase [Bacillota bacterium]
MSWSERIQCIPSGARARYVGHVVAASKDRLHVVGLSAAIGDICALVGRDGTDMLAEVIAVEAPHTLILAAYGELSGTAVGQPVWWRSAALEVPMGAGLLGRLMDALGVPLDKGSALHGIPYPAAFSRIAPLDRRAVSVPLWTGIKAIDGLLTIGEGQRLGIIARAGSGKTTLLQWMLANVHTDVIVMAMIGERGREVAEFYHQLDDSQRKRTVMVAETSDRPAISRLRAAYTAHAVARFFAEKGRKVVLAVDSLTRIALAAREVAMQAGEAPVLHGYTPSVFQLLPPMIEQAGCFASGSVTAFYTVLLEEEEEMADPLAEAARGLLDG